MNNEYNLYNKLSEIARAAVDKKGSATRCVLMN